jgi:hypothetical protein
MTPNNRLERSRGLHLRWATEGIDDLDKSVSFDVDAIPRRSTSSLDEFADQFYERALRLCGMWRYYPNWAAQEWVAPHRRRPF